MQSPRYVLLVVGLGLAGCPDASGKEDVKLRPAPVTPSANAPKPVEDYGLPDDKPPNPEDLAEKRAERDKKKGDKNDSEWVAKEWTSGMARWKDTGVYVDGIPAGFLAWGELPIGCKASWAKAKVSAEVRYGTKDPGWRWQQTRFYKFTDYLKAIGIEPRTVKELHVYGPKMSQTLIVTGKDLASPRANDFSFRFGGTTSGKAIPHAPEGFGNGRVADKINGVMVYITKKPPTLVPNDGLYLDDVEQTGVPYYGEPIRGGVRIYLDDKLVTIIKRQELDPKKATKAIDGSPQWKFSEFLTAHGVDAKNVVEIWTIRADKRSEKFVTADLPKLAFEAGSQSRGGVSLGLETADDKPIANAIAMHTRALTPADMPIPEQDDE